MKNLNSNNKESFPLWRKLVISVCVIIMPICLYISFKEASTTRSIANSSFLKVDDGKLSNEKAQRALDIFMDGAGKATIVGVQEETNSSAVADLNFQNLPYNEYGKSKQYSGAGKAYFIRYNDGKWMMNKLTFIPLDRAQYDHNALTLELKNKIEAK